MYCIYKITNLVNGKSYIGKSCDVEARWRTHGKENTRISRAVKKHGRDAFSWDIIQTGIPNNAEANVAERFFIKVLGTYGNGYNDTPGGDGCGSGEDHYMADPKRAEEAKRKMSEGRKGVPKSEKTKKKMSEANKGKKLSEETKRKISKAKKGNYTGEKHPRSKLTDAHCREIYELYATGNYTQAEIGKIYGVAHQSISRILKGRKK